MYKRMKIEFESLRDVIKGVYGYSYSQVDTESMKVICEMPTGGDDGDGYAGSQTIGLAKTDCQCYCLFTSSMKRTKNCTSSTIFMGQGVDDLPSLLRDLANKIEAELPGKKLNCKA